MTVSNQITKFIINTLTDIDAYRFLWNLVCIVESFLGCKFRVWDQWNKIKNCWCIIVMQNFESLYKFMDFYEIIL